MLKNKLQFSSHLLQVPSQVQLILMNWLLCSHTQVLQFSKHLEMCYNQLIHCKATFHSSKTGFRLVKTRVAL